ncbi:MAG: patatin-like phospholipase family protein [Planctomycetota bacterium]|nr:patatin-like phospholipase family protein [Planctomycetota bacterium]MDA1113952.1 patatin-like phospholipase family protein [Planctomycetota bacterium]
MSEQPLEVVLALGGGAARGLAHIGILRVLEEQGVVVRGIAGTSIGAIAGGLYAAGKLDFFESYIRKLDAKGMLRLLDPVLPRAGLIGGNRVVSRLQEFLGAIEVQELQTPFCAIATHLETGNEVVLSSGNLVNAIRASFAIPGVFTPVQIDGEWLVDGGVSTPVPIRAARALCPGLPVIAVNLSNIDNVFAEEPADSVKKASKPQTEAEREIGRIERLLKRMSGDRGKRPSLLTSISDSVLHMEHRISRFQIAADEPELLLEPSVFGVGLFDFHRATPIITAGAKCANEAVASGALKRLIAK